MDQSVAPRATPSAAAHPLLVNGRRSLAMEPTQRTTQPIKIGLAWLVVVVPLAWGVFNTLVKAAALFH